ncbi:MAG: YceI family protein, partial [Actinomycetota bacterium]
FQGKVEGDPKDITEARGSVEIDVASIDTGNVDRDGHLKSADFFDVERYPKIVFATKEIRKQGDGFKVVGELTIKGITKEVELDYEHGGEGVDPFGNRKIGGTLTGTVNRRDWGLNWNVPLDTGGMLVSEKIKLEIDFQLAENQEAVEQEAEAESEITA